MRNRIQVTIDRRRCGLSADPHFRDWTWIKRSALRVIVLVVASAVVAAVATFARVALAW